MTVSYLMEKFHSLLLIFTLIKKVNLIQKFMTVSITFVVINNEETPIKDFIQEHFLEVKAVAIRTKTLSMINCILLQSLFLALVIIDT